MELKGEVFIHDNEVRFDGSDERDFVFGGLPLETLVLVKMKHLGVLKNGAVCVKIDGQGIRIEGLLTLREGQTRFTGSCPGKDRISWLLGEAVKAELEENGMTSAEVVITLEYPPR